LAEAGGGLLFALGLGTPFAAAAIGAVMINAIAVVHLDNGPWITEGGYEYSLVLIAVVLAPVLAGPGDASIDALIGWDLAGLGWGVATAVAMVGLAAATLLTRTEAAEAPEEAPADAGIEAPRRAA
jgi:hypothetical protein